MAVFVSLLYVQNEVSPGRPASSPRVNTRGMNRVATSNVALFSSSHTSSSVVCRRPLGTILPSSAHQPLGRRVPLPPVGVLPAPSQALGSPDRPMWCGGGLPWSRTRLPLRVSAIETLADEIQIRPSYSKRLPPSHSSVVSCGPRSTTRSVSALTGLPPSDSGKNWQQHANRLTCCLGLTF